MTKEEMKNLCAGDIVQGKFSGYGYIVSRNYGDVVTLVRTVDMTNPIEWKLIKKKGE